MSLAYVLRGELTPTRRGVVVASPPQGDDAMRPSLLLVTLAIALTLTMESPADQPKTDSAADPIGLIYDSEPTHLWNRLHRALWVRKDKDGKEYGHDVLSPLIWSNSKFLVEGKSYRVALSVLDEFIRERGEQLINDLLKQAVLQHDLWAVFDATHKLKVPKDGPAFARVNQLRKRLAEAIRLLALDDKAINTLTDTYASATSSKVFAGDFDPLKPGNAFLPTDLLDPNGSWVCVRGGFPGPSAPAHVEAFGGRSPFLVFIRTPNGREATLRYLARLNRAAATTTSQDWRPTMPQFPVGTAVTMVRHLTVIDKHGKIAVTPIVQSVQLRVYRQIGQSVNHLQAQSTFKFTLIRRQLFANVSGGLKLTPDKQTYVENATSFLHQRYQGDRDLFEKKDSNTVQLLALKNSCVACHSCGGSGTVTSVLTFNPHGWVDGADKMKSTDHRLSSTKLKREHQELIRWKQAQGDWKSLTSFWDSNRKVNLESSADRLDGVGLVCADDDRKPLTQNWKVSVFDEAR